jgi:hypothetical protein
MQCGINHACRFSYYTAYQLADANKIAALISGLSFLAAELKEKGLR